MAARVRAVDRHAVEMRRDEAVTYLEVALLYVESTSHADWKAAGANAVLGGTSAGPCVLAGHSSWHALQAPDRREDELPVLIVTGDTGEDPRACDSTRAARQRDARSHLRRAAPQRGRRIRIGPFTVDGSTTLPCCVISTSPRATIRRAARRAGSISGRQSSRSRERATSDGQMLDVRARAASNSSIRCSRARSVSSIPCLRQAREHHFVSGAADDGMRRPHEAQVRSACSDSDAVASVSVLMARPMAPSSSHRSRQHTAQVRLAPSQW